MTKAITQQAKLIMNYREAVFVVLVSCFALSLCWYGYSVRQAIVNVVTREALIKDIQKKSTAVADLETKYFSLKNSVSIDLAHQEGFAEAPVSMFISKKAVGVATTLGSKI